MANAPSKVVKSVNRWTPNPAPVSNENLSDYLYHELNRLSDVLFNIDVMRLESTHRVPEKARAGDIRYSDGSDWAAGQGENLYYYNGAKWIAFAGGSGAGSYAEFFDTSQQTAASINTAYPITWNGTDVTNGVSLNVSDTSKMEFTYGGIYHVDMSATIHSTSASSKDVWIWPRINGVDVANSSSMDLIAARPKTGKSVLADNVALHVSKTHNIPVLMLDTEMSKEDHINRLLANLTETEINDIAGSKFFDNDEKKDKIIQGASLIKSLPYDYISIAGRPFEETLSIAKRWLIKKVGYDEDGNLNDCLIIYDYLKLMTSASINNNLAEFQVLGFQITSLHNFCVENDCPCLSFVQLNRDGITKESTDVVSGSDRLVWLCTSFSIFKDKTEEERLTDGVSSGNKKLIPIVSRHGPGIEDEGYICLQMDGQYAKVRELGTIRSMKRHENSHEQGFADQADYDPEDETNEEDF